MAMQISGESNQQYKRIGVHILFWAAYILFFGSIYGKYGHNFSWYFIESFCMLPFIMAATYITIYGVLPFYLKKRKLLPTVILMALILFSATLGERVLLRVINNLPVNYESIFGVTFLYLFLETNFIVGIAFAIKIIKKWMEQQQEKHEMEKQNLKTELNLLKAQLNPHFLFNTMNNLYSLSLEESSKTSDGIAKTAELLRSVLYECNEPEIPLEKELNLLENYIELEKMRYGQKLELDFRVEGPVKSHKIAPMLLFTFVENCFKHGCGNNLGKSCISVFLQAENDRFRFLTANNKTPNKSTTSKKSGGIGLKNARKRLEIIYPEKHRLTVSDDGNRFKLNLEIWS
jgi:LytS/YehU family sensor histidine kinase